MSFGHSKRERGSLAFGGVRAEDLTDEVEIARRIEWLNRNGKLLKEVDIDEVAMALASIGVHQSMRVLRRLEEGAASIDDPNEFIKDLVARSGWISARPDVIEDDVKVAKRVSLLNQFGGLMQPVNYAEVALDALLIHPFGDAHTRCTAWHTIPCHDSCTHLTHNTLCWLRRRSVGRGSPGRLESCARYGVASRARGAGSQNRGPHRAHSGPRCSL